MITLGKGFCVFLSVAGSFYCINFLRDCWQHSSFALRRTGPPVSSVHHSSISVRAEWCCQFVLAALGLWFALTMIVANGGEVFLLLWRSIPNVQSTSNQVDSVSSPEYSGAKVRYDTHQSIIGIDWARSHVSDEQVSNLLHTAPGLAWLILTATPITDGVLEELHHTPSLNSLCLDQTQITDEGLAYLKEMTNLEGLSLGQTQITDEGLAYLQGLTNLHVLCLDHTRITDDGLACLQGLTRLEMLYLCGTHVTDEGVNKFKKAHPNCGVSQH